MLSRNVRSATKPYTVTTDPKLYDEEHKMIMYFLFLYIILILTFFFTWIELVVVRPFCLQVL